MSMFNIPIKFQHSFNQCQSIIYIHVYVYIICKYFYIVLTLKRVCNQTVQPQSAKVKAVRRRPGVKLARFDQCQFGLVSSVNKMPVRKRTCVLTNSEHIFKALDSKFCPGDHDHQVIQGSEGGRKRSEAAQEYPGPLVEALCQGFLAEQRRR